MPSAGRVGRVPFLGGIALRVRRWFCCRSIVLAFVFACVLVALFACDGDDDEDDGDDDDEDVVVDDDDCNTSAIIIIVGTIAILAVVDVRQSKQWILRWNLCSEIVFGAVFAMAMDGEASWCLFTL